MPINIAGCATACHASTTSSPEEARNWRPHNLAGRVAALCKEQNIAFYDALPPLRAAAEQGRYVHHRILDCHVNAEGSRILGEVIASALKPAP